MLVAKVSMGPRGAVLHWRSRVWRARNFGSVMSEPDRASSARYVWYVALLLAAVNMVNYVDRMAVAVLAPQIKVEFALSDAKLGLLTGFAFAIFYAICGIPIARWADRSIRRNIIALALTTWSLMTALSGAALHFWHLLLARIGVAAGEAGSWAPGASILCDYVPLKRRSGMLAVHAFGNYAGILLGMALTGGLGQALGWRWTFVVLGLPGLALALVVRFTLREPTRGHFDVAKANDTVLSFAETMAFLCRCRTYRLLVLFLVANGFVQYGLSQWWPSFYVRLFGMDLTSVGLYLGICYGAGAGAGVLLGGLVANTVAERDIRLPLMIGGAATALSLPAVLASLFVSSAKVSIALVLLTAVLWGVSNGPVMAAANSVVTSRMRATAGGISIFFISVFGFGLGPFCVGVLSDVLAPSMGVESLRYALLVPICLILVMVIALVVAARALREDLEAVGARVDDGPTTAVATARAISH
jgi:predicted MFS family arabinose efflux permease